MELHFLALRKRDRLSRIIWSEVSEVSETRESGSGYILTRIMAAELPEVLDVSSDDLHKYFFWEEDDSICLVAPASTFCQQNQQSASPVFSLDVSQAGSWKLEAWIKQVKEVLSTDHETAFHQDVTFHLNYARNYRKFYSNSKRSRFDHKWLTTLQTSRYFNRQKL